MDSPTPCIWPESAIEAVHSSLRADKSICLLNAEGTNVPTIPPHSRLREHNILRQAGCLELAQPHPSYIPLTTIHPLFWPDKWDKTGVEHLVNPAFQVLKPALTLATKWITHPSMTRWWIHVLYGKFSTDEETGKFHLASDAQELDIEQAAEDLQEAFEELSEHLRWFWMPSSEEYTAVTHWNPWSALTTIDQCWEVEVDSHKEEFAPAIGLPTLFLYHLLSSSSARQSSFSTDMRLQFYIAKTMVHELAHAFCMMVHLYWVEPYINLHDEMPEAGYSWQQAIFGCDVAVFPLRHEVIGPVIAMTFEQMHAFPGIYVPVPISWVERFFLQSTWGGSVDVEPLKPQTADTLPKRYGGLVCADRYIAAANIWSRVLYQDSRPVSLMPLKIPGESCLTGGVVGIVMVGMIPPRWTVQEWFDQTREKDVEKAKATGGSAEPFVKGRHKLYQELCYDGDGKGRQC